MWKWLKGLIRDPKDFFYGKKKVGETPGDLRVYSRKKLNEAFGERPLGAKWDFYAERAHAENLFCQRINFLLVFYSLFVMAAASVGTPEGVTVIFFLGAFITSIIGVTVWRIYVKFTILMRILRALDSNFLSFQEDETNALPGWKRGFPVNHLLGIWLPFFCAATLLLGGILSACGKLVFTK
ncbi:MAG: hypothetical protein WC712_11060 [Candidatus Brocadiia bacterium]